MSKLDELIKELCPDGVEYKTLGEVIFSLNTGLNPRNFFRLNTDDAKNYYVTIREMVNGKIVFSDNTDRINDEALKLCNNRSNLEKGDVLFSGTGTIGRTVVIDKTPKNWNIKEGVYTIKPNQSFINSRFLSYLLQSDKIKRNYMKKVAGGTVQSIPMSDLKNQTIPVPPLPVQEEIVRILDNFTSLTAELTAELTARRKQYEYYRDSLLSPESISREFACKLGKIGNADRYSLLTRETKVEHKKLNEIAEIYDGTHQTPEYKDSGIPFISVENIDDIYSSKKFISTEAYNQYKIKPQLGDLFMTRIGSIGKCAVMNKEMDLAYYVSLALIRPNQQIINTRYLKHFIESTQGKKELSKRTLHHAVPIKVNKDDVGKIEIAFPTLEIQEKIVNVLDNFDSICTDLKIGLPAEIEARKKQYEYYCDLLLTFASSGNTILSEQNR